VGATGIVVDCGVAAAEFLRSCDAGTPRVGVRACFWIAERSSGCKGIELVGGAIPGEFELFPVGGSTTEAPKTKAAIIKATFMIFTSATFDYFQKHPSKINDFTLNLYEFYT
jgi:hypothetical protein